MTDENTQERSEEPVVAGRLLVTDLKRSGALAPFDLFGALNMRNSVMGSTNFENKELEEMYALVDGGDPGDIESAADRLWEAGGDIRQIGEDLKKHIDKVDWEGEFGDSFRDWGRKLSRNTILLADFTEKAGIHLKAAGVGLATVRGSMPERDPAVMAAPRLESIPPEERDESDEKYRLAKRKEDNRQEAVNQMNRLASYYRVSHENMQGLQEPEFGPMPDVGMPPAPPPQDSVKIAPGGGSGSAPAAHGGGGAAWDAWAAEAGPPSSTPGKPGSVEGSPAPRESVRIDLDTAAPPATTTPTDTGQRAPLPSGAGGPAAPNTGVPGAPPVLAPDRSGGNRRVGTAKPPPPPNPVRPGAGRESGASTASPANNATTRSVTGTGGAPVGKPPASTVPPMGRGGHGVFGGTPTQGGTTSESPRVPRGTVVGTEHGTAGRPPTGAAGPGAVGGAGTGSGSAGYRPGVGAGGVVGASRSAPDQAGAARPFTPGGTGLTRSGATGDSRTSTGAVPRTGTTSPRPREENRNDSRRPDYLTEDEETWRTGRSGIAPPVVDQTPQ
ncbi:hypothetical protein F0L17_19590 [Streptomyces sp. TRM43335]|uniref:Uncharacterized protein n=1 Tax=Streptomyces taklimakanensis TaxID=2569853 RepID=A0A6G2BG86_9ACTN|nr:WXG100 family type VII secretion target [Streptomyces taklimakanensis]MTE21278.1 hypothetical protein [Streptomyces taklimakanensis]